MVAHCKNNAQITGIQSATTASFCVPILYSNSKRNAPFLRIEMDIQNRKYIYFIDAFQRRQKALYCNNPRFGLLPDKLHYIEIIYLQKACFRRMQTVI